MRSDPRPLVTHGSGLRAYVLAITIAGAALPLLAAGGCEGTIEEHAGASSPGAPSGDEGADGDRDGPGDRGDGGALGPSGGVWSPIRACDPVMPQRVTRLSDQHLANAVRDLLAVDRPDIETGSLGATSFLPPKPAAVTGSVAVKLQSVAETVAAQATQPGQPAIACSAPKTEPDCAGDFVDRFAARAFRRPLAAEERSELLALYEVGRSLEGTHGSGIALVIEAVVQSPSFVYLAELGTETADGQYVLSGHELAAKLSLFLRDTLPDDALWEAAQGGALDSEAGIAAEVGRLLEDEAVQANLSRALFRFFDLESLPEIRKAEEIDAFSPALAAAMYGEATRFIDDVLWQQSGSLHELLTSRTAWVDGQLAALYGVAGASGDAPAQVSLPDDERAGILTRAGVMAVKASADDTSVVFRGLLVLRGLLCVSPPPPSPAAMELGEMIRREVPTERGRAERRLGLDMCKPCHGMFDPLGITFEHYDTLGRYRTAIDTSEGELAVDAAWDVDVADVRGHVDGAVELSQRLAESHAARECMVQQVAAYAIGERLAAADLCTLGELAARFEQSGGDLRALIEGVATWPGLRMRRAEETP